MQCFTIVYTVILTQLYWTILFRGEGSLIICAILLYDKDYFEPQSLTFISSLKCCPEGYKGAERGCEMFCQSPAQCWNKSGVWLVGLCTTIFFFFLEGRQPSFLFFKHSWMENQSNWLLNWIHEPRSTLGLITLCLLMVWLPQLQKSVKDDMLGSSLDCEGKLQVVLFPC